MADESLAELSPRERALIRLSASERQALSRYSENAPPLSPNVQAQLFELYLNGNSTEEIARLNKNFTLGMIVRAKVEGLWDDRKAAHISEMLDSVRERVQQVQMESVLFSADLLSAANKRFGEKLKRYIQTGDERELGELSIESLKQYKEAVDLLFKLTHQDKESKVKITGDTKVEHTFVTQPKQPMTPQDAAVILAELEKGIKNK